MLRITNQDPFALDVDEWPRDVDLIISALHAAGAHYGERRGAPRRRYRVIAQLSLFCSASKPPVRLYVRDCTERHLGFLSQVAVPLGFGGTVEFPAPDQQLLEAGCIVNRSRECVPGWYEGVLQFNRVQTLLRFPT